MNWLSEKNNRAKLSLARLLCPTAQRFSSILYIVFIGIA